MQTTLHQKLQVKIRAHQALDQLTTKLNNDARVLLARQQVRIAKDNLTKTVTQVQKELGWLDSWINAADAAEEYKEANVSEHEEQGK
jgi:hypothetical protein